MEPSSAEDGPLGSAIVVGGASGIGLATSRRLGELGASVLIADLEAPAELPANARFVPVDVTRADDVAALSALAAQVDAFATVIYTAGRGLHERLDRGDPEKWARLIDVNFVGALRIVRALVPLLEARGRGDVVLVTSVAARRSFPCGGVYAASKAALERAAEALRLELLPAIRVTTVAPGIVDTPFFSRAEGAMPGPAEIGWGALAPEEVAEIIAFALTRARNVVISEIVVRPPAQEL